MLQEIIELGKYIVSLKTSAQRFLAFLLLTIGVLVYLSIHLYKEIRQRDEENEKKLITMQSKIDVITEKWRDSENECNQRIYDLVNKQLEEEKAKTAKQEAVNQRQVEALIEAQKNVKRVEKTVQRINKAIVPKK